MLRRYYDHLQHADEKDRYALQELMNKTLAILVKENAFNRGRVAWTSDHDREEPTLLEAAEELIDSTA
jgi:hypothetical protein